MKRVTEASEDHERGSHAGPVKSEASPEGGLAGTVATRAEKIGERIRVLMRRKGMDQKTLGAALNITGNAVSQIVSGKSTGQYVKLGHLAAILGVDPNAVLGFPSGSSREMLLGALEGCLLGLEFSTSEAEEIAAIVLEVIDAPHSAHTATPRQTAKILAEFLVRKQKKSP
jgi:transcriptional regulator with XRE-family HTH domain